jgi:murein DD-endopeptidase MepM/ murein hydrolase activator NlpD
MGKTPYVTILFIPDGSEARHGFHVPRWSLWAAAAAVALLVVGIVLFFIFYGVMASRAALTERVQAENEALLRYRYKVLLLEDNLNEVRDVVTRLTKLAGVDYEFPDVPTDSEISVAVNRAAESGDTLALLSGGSVNIPIGLPVKGYVTQEFSGSETGKFHPGIDIACAVGTAVAATGTGDVIFAGYDSTYGNMVVIRHNDSLSTVYGHNDKLLVQRGQRVSQGSTIALSGNTGVSTAPHVHYEVRLNGKSVNPMERSHDQENHH